MFSTPFFNPPTLFRHHHQPRFPTLHDDEFFVDVPRSLGQHLLRDPMSAQETMFDEMKDGTETLENNIIHHQPAFPKTSSRQLCMYCSKDQSICINILLDSHQVCNKEFAFNSQILARPG